jgi:hypothetical protein
MYRYIFLIIIFSSILTGCSNKQSSKSRPEKSDLFKKGQKMGVVTSTLEEASGLAASITNKGFLWTQNDSGNDPEVYLIDDKAEIKLTCKLKGATNRDWEEIFIGPGPKSGTPYVYVADIGDNFYRYDNKFLYRFQEPKLNLAKDTTIKVDTIAFKLCDEERDAETIFYDSIFQAAYLITKRESSVKMYEIKFPILKDTVEAMKVADLPFSGVVAADISRSGEEVLLKDRLNIYYWKRQPGESLVDLFQRPPQLLNYKPEQQGEAVAWKWDGSGYYTLSESSKWEMANLIFYKRN